MKKDKNVEMDLTREDLRIKLRRFKQEIQETKERRIEMELAITVAQAKSAALDVELATMMVRFAIMNQETTAMRKKDDDIALRLQRLREKYSYFNQEANVTGPEYTELEAIEEEPEEEIVYRPPFQGRLKEGDEKITLETYQREHSWEQKLFRVLSCTSGFGLNAS
uniref:Uncharacterized protein n=1 Tax=Solanum tuberosum TaxID=4113 RepID=M1DND8_SOLTU